MIFSLLPDRLAGGVRMLLIASTAMGSIGPAHADTIPPPDIETQNRTTVRAAFEKWRAGGNIFAELLAPDVVWTIHGSAPVAGTYRGVEDFVERASAPLISRLATLWCQGCIISGPMETRSSSGSTDRQPRLRERLTEISSSGYF